MVDVNYISTVADACSGFNDPAKGKTAAEGMYDSGADIVYQAAGGSGTGVFQAATEKGKWAIGVDSDQYNTVDPSLRDVIITSMLKRVDAAPDSVAERDQVTGTADCVPAEGRRPHADDLAGRLALGGQVAIHRRSGLAGDADNQGGNVRVAGAYFEDRLDRHRRRGRVGAPSSAVLVRLDDPA